MSPKQDFKDFGQFLTWSSITFIFIYFAAQVIQFLF